MLSPQDRLKIIESLQLEFRKLTSESLNNQTRMTENDLINTPENLITVNTGITGAVGIALVVSKDLNQLSVVILTVSIVVALLVIVLSMIMKRHSVKVLEEYYAEKSFHFNKTEQQYFNLTNNTSLNQVDHTDFLNKIKAIKTKSTEVIKDCQLRIRKSIKSLSYLVIILQIATVFVTVLVIVGIIQAQFNVYQVIENAMNYLPRVQCLIHFL